MGWGFVWLMLVLKIPIAMLLYIVWWAVHQEPDPEAADDGEGGLGTEPSRTPRPMPPAPRRRGPHGEPPVPSPPRTRTPRETLPVREPTPARDPASR